MFDFSAKTAKILLRTTRNFFLRDRPFFAHLHVTKRCNLRCKYCGVRKNPKPKELSKEDFIRIINILDRMGVVQISFTGGESLLNPDIFDLIKYANKRGFWTQITSNGTMPQHMYRRLLETKIDLISISLDSLKKEVHNAQRGHFDEVIKNLKFLAKNKAKGQSINISAMVTEKNIKELPEIVSFAKSLGINIFLSPVMYSHYSDDYGFRPKGNGYLDKEKVMETYSALKRQYFSSGMMTPPYYLRLSEKYLISQKNKWNCKAGLVFFDIMPDGEFYICQDFSMEKNILDKDFLEWYGSKEFNEKRKRLAHKCEGCVFSCYYCTQNMFSLRVFETALTFFKNFIATL